MSARDALAAALWDNYTVAEKNEFIDDYAHELAEQIRAMPSSGYAYDHGRHAAAELIDPLG